MFIRTLSIKTFITVLCANHIMTEENAENIWLDVQKIQQFLAKITPPNLPILIIDDDPSIGKLITGLLKRLDFENSTFVDNGIDAVEICQNQEFSVIFLDLQLPHLNGLKILKEIKTNPSSKCKDARVIILTGLPSLESAIEAMQVGAFNYIGKPMSIEKFDEAFEQALNDFYNQRREDLISKYMQHHQSEDIYQLKQEIAEKNEKIKQLEAQIKILQKSL
ncbi:Protein-glutamate methylesterase/protein-glutamine glutaminase [Candidatus Lokiarchaeum ossiferum]